MPGHKPNNSKKKWRENFKRQHPEGAKEFSADKKRKRLEKKVAKVKSNKKNMEKTIAPAPEETPEEEIPAVAGVEEDENSPL